MPGDNRVKQRSSTRSRRQGPAEVPLYGFRPPVGTPFSLEVTTLEDFFDKYNPWPWDAHRHGRATFHYLVLVVEGELVHDVDYVAQTVVAGQWLWVRPGHTQSWHLPSATRGPFILFEPDLLSPNIAHLLTRATSHDAPAVLTPQAADAAWLKQTALQLLDEHRSLGRRQLEVHHALERSLLEALLLRLSSSPAVSPTTAAATGRDTYARFMDALELSFRELHHAAEYARLLGCSVRTLSRATHEAVGKGTRELIDERRLTEARRLLAVAGWDARTVAAHLGFTDPANFGRFFRSRSGVTPAAFATHEARNRS